MFKQYLADLKKEFKGYNAKFLSKDIVAGLTVTAVALPLALAFGVSSGADAAAGLITAILAGILIGSLSGGSFQISGPTGTMTVILGTIIARFGLSGVFVASMMAGIILIICALFKVGKLVSFIPPAVVTGFTSGIALIIALGQINNFFGVTSQGDNALSRLASYFKLGFNINWYATLVAVFVVAIMIFFPKKWNAVFPASLLAIIITVIINIIFKLPLNVVGDIPKAILLDKRLDLSLINLDLISKLITPSISIAALIIIESLLCGASASRMKKGSFNADRELFALGVGNFIIPFFGGVPAASAIARTSFNIKSGSKTRVSSVVHSLGLLASMFLLGGIMSKIPLSALAGVLMVTAFRTNDWITIKYIFKKNFKVSIVQFLTTMLATVIFDLSVAIIAGVFISILFFVAKISNAEIEISDIDYNKLNISNELQKQHIKNIKICYISGPIFFGSFESIITEVEKLKDYNVLIFSMRGVPMIDAGSAYSLLEKIASLNNEGKQILFCGLQPKVKHIFKKSGIISHIGEKNIYWDAKQAIDSQI